MASSITSSSSVKAFQNSTHAPSQNGVVVNLVKEALAGSEMNLNETCIQNTRAYVVFKSYSGPRKLDRSLSYVLC